jgi:uncharacterized nucleotidyltransferase DUF6036
VTDVQRLLDALADARVDFVVVGGVALVLRGSSRVTLDLDVCYSRERDNLRRVAAALGPFHPRLRGAPPDLPFLWDDRTLASGLNFTLTTDLGDIDVLGEIPGVGNYERVAAGSSSVSVGSVQVLVMDLDALERAKRAAGRAKDLLDLAEIAEIRRRLAP